MKMLRLLSSDFKIGSGNFDTTREIRRVTEIFTCFLTPRLHDEDRIYFNSSKSTDSLRHKLSNYRGLYLINVLYNECYHATLLPCRYLLNAFGIISSGFILTRFQAKISFPDQVLCLTTFVAMLAAPLVYLHISGMVLAKSIALCGKLGRFSGERCTRKEMQVLRRDARSIQPFGIRVGSIKSTSYAALSAFLIQTTSLFTTVLVTFPQKG